MEAWRRQVDDGQPDGGGVIARSVLRFRVTTSERPGQRAQCGRTGPHPYCGTSMHRHRRPGFLPSRQRRAPLAGALTMEGLSVSDVEESKPNNGARWRGPRGDDATQVRRVNVAGKARADTGTDSDGQHTPGTGGSTSMSQTRASWTTAGRVAQSAVSRRQRVRRVKTTGAVASPRQEW